MSIYSLITFGGKMCFRIPKSKYLFSKNNLKIMECQTYTWSVMACIPNIQYVSSWLHMQRKWWWVFKPYSSPYSTPSTRSSYKKVVQCDSSPKSSNHIQRSAVCPCPYLSVTEKASQTASLRSRWTLSVKINIFFWY